MNNYSKVKVSKNFLKKSLVENEDISKALSRFIDNSIKARSEITTNINPCIVEINIFDDLIAIKDNSGGIEDALNGDQIFKIGNYQGDGRLGVGMKKSLFRLGNKMDIVSNRATTPRKFTVDFNFDDDELVIQTDELIYNENEVEGTKIFISDLDKSTKKEIKEDGFIKKVLLKLGRRYSKFMDSNQVIIKVNGMDVVSVNISAQKLASCEILDGYIVDLYKGNKNDISGVDLFINNYMIYDRDKSKAETKWNQLNEAKHTYTDCIVEINYEGYMESFEEHKEELFTHVINFIKENKIYFESKTITIQYEMPIEKVEELKEYYGENTAKAIGIKAFNSLYEDYSYNKNKGYYKAI